MLQPVHQPVAPARIRRGDEQVSREGDGTDSVRCTHASFPEPMARSDSRRVPVKVLTRLDELQRRIRVLASMEETEAPVVSCYVCLDQGISAARYAFAQWCGAIRATIDTDAIVQAASALVPGRPIRHLRSA